MLESLLVLLTIEDFLRSLRLPAEEYYKSVTIELLNTSTEKPNMIFIRTMDATKIRLTESAMVMYLCPGSVYFLTQLDRTSGCVSIKAVFSEKEGRPNKRGVGSPATMGFPFKEYACLLRGLFETWKCYSFSYFQ